MRLEVQVCTPAQSKMIADYIGSREPLFYWVDTGQVEHWELISSDDAHDKHEGTVDSWFDLGRSFCLDAYTVAELGVMLGNYYVSPGKYSWFICVKGDYGNALIDIPYTSAHTEAQARATALIWLLENKHIKPEDIKL